MLFLSSSERRVRVHLREDESGFSRARPGPGGAASDSDPAARSVSGESGRSVGRAWCVRAYVHVLA